MKIKSIKKLRLSQGAFRRHKKCSILTVMIVSVLLGIIMSFGLALQGLRNTVLQAALQGNDNKIYISVSYKLIYSYVEGLELNTSDFIKMNNLADAYDIIHQSALQHQGQVIGEQTKYQIGETAYYVIDRELAEHFSESNFNNIKLEQAPYTTSESSRSDSQPTNENTINNTGRVKNETYSAMRTRTNSPVLHKSTLLNLLLNDIHDPTNLIPSLLVDDGSGVIMRYIESLSKPLINKYGYKNLDEILTVWPPEKYYIVLFNNYEDAKSYYLDMINGRDVFRLIETKDADKYMLTASELYSNIISAIMHFENIQVMFNIIIVLLTIVVIIVAALVFARLVMQDIYYIIDRRAEDVSISNIRSIYLIYLIKLCLLTILLCVLFALTFACVIWMLNADVLLGELMDFYMLQDYPKITLIGYNDMFFWIISIIILIVPFSLFLALKYFPVEYKNVMAKKE